MKKARKHLKAIISSIICLAILSQAFCLTTYAATDTDVKEIENTSSQQYNPEEDSTFVLSNSNVQISDEDYLPESAYISEIEASEWQPENNYEDMPEGIISRATVGDPMVYLTQKWLNQEYGDVPGFGSVPENGKTGWDTVYGLTRALQHELGITDLANNFGPTTAKLYGKNPLHRQDGVTNRQFAILQGALWCKGYSPGYYLHENPDGTVEFEEIFNENVERAVIELKKDAGFINPDGVVTVNVMKALMSMDAFKLLSAYGGDVKVREMQQKLNRKYEAYTGLTPCDGVYGRNTNKAIVYALQAEEGLPTSVANGNFGNTTKKCCPQIPYARNSSAAKNYYGSYYSSSTISAMTELVQFALYVNGFGDGVTDGVFDSGTQQAIRAFQKKYAIPQTGIADKTTWLSLFISCGDTSRSAKAADCATQLTAAQAKTLYDNGYRYIGRYLTGTYNGGKDKSISRAEAQRIFDAGLNFFPIYQTSARSNSYFTEAQGIEDAYAAIEAATKLGVPRNTIIYFAVDFDCMDYQITSNIIPYFKAVHSVMSKGVYKTGIYGTRNACTRVSEKGYACSSFVGDMSTGFSGNLGYSMPDNWAFDQFNTTTIGSDAGRLEIDKDGFSGKDHGVSKLDPTVSQVKAPAIDFGLAQSDVMQGPTINIFGNEVPLFELNVEFDIPFFDDMPEMEYDREKEMYKISYGLAETEADPDLKDENYAEIKEMINAFNHKTSTTTWNKYQKLRSKLKKRNIKFGFEFNGELSGYLGLNKDGEIVENGFLVTANATPSFSYPLVPLIYAKLEIVGSVEAGFSMEFKEVGVLNPNGAVEFSVEPRLGLEANAIVASAFGGISGNLACRLELPMSSLKEDFSSTFQGSVFLELAALSWGTTLSLDFPELQLYPKPASKNVLSVTDNDLKLIDPIRKDTTTYAKSKPNVVSENMQTYCQPRIISLGNNRMLMVYIDDAQNRSPENRTILMYSVFDGTSWSSPEPVLDDATGDFSPFLYSDGNGGAHILWQNATAEFNSDVTLEEMSSKMDLYYTHWDGENFVNSIPITDGNSNYEIPHKIVSSSDNISVVWQQNSENDPFAIEGTNSIFRRQFTNGSWQDIELMSSDLKIVNSVDTTYIDGINIVAFSAKTTDDTSTLNDMEIFYCLDPNVDPVAVTDDNTADYSICFSNENLYWISGNSIKSMDKFNSSTVVIDTLDPTASKIKAIESQDGRKAIVWTQIDDKDTKFYASYYNESTANYGTPIPISDGDDVIRNWDVCMQSDGQIELAYSAAESLEESADGKPYGQLDLIQKAGKEFSDISVNSLAAYDGEILPDSEIAVITEVYNTGSETINQFDVNIIGSDGNILQSTTVDHVLDVGESTQIEVPFTLPSFIQRTEYKVQVLPHGKTDISTSDNEAAFTIGYADIAVEIDKLQTDEGGQLKITITNKGFETINSAILNIRQKNVDGDILDSIEIPQLLPGKETVLNYSLTDEMLDPTTGGLSNMLYLQVDSLSEESDYTNNSQVVPIYSIKLTSSAGGTVQGSGVYATGTIATFTAIPDSRYMLESWYENDKSIYSSSPNYQMEINSAHTFEAKFIPNNLAITDIEVFGTLKNGEVITFTTAVEGGIDPYQWEFYIYKGEDICYSNGKVNINFFEWSPETSGNYKIIVNVTDASGFKATYSKDFVVT